MGVWRLQSDLFVGQDRRLGWRLFVTRQNATSTPTFTLTLTNTKTRCIHSSTHTQTHTHTHTYTHTHTHTHTPPNPHTLGLHNLTPSSTAVDRSDTLNPGPLFPKDAEALGGCRKEGLASWPELDRWLKSGGEREGVWDVCRGEEPPPPIELTEFLRATKQ